VTTLGRAHITPLALAGHRHFIRWVRTAMLGLGPESAHNCSCIFQFPDFLFDLNSRKNMITF
jgi:hypothetical protein